MDATEILRPGKDERREAIVTIALEFFLANGYAGTSMSAIAARVGGSKGTLYNYFSSKEELFIAVVERKCEQIQGFLYQSEVEGGGDLREALTRFGERFLQLLLADEAIATHRLVTAESARFPEIGRALYNSGVRQGRRRMCEYLQRAKDAGQLRSDADVTTAAEHYFGMCMSDIHHRRLWNVTPVPSLSEIHRYAANAADAFMRAYGT